MRARVNTPLDYEGPWSEWSEEFAWKTEHGTSHAGCFNKVLWAVNGWNTSIETHILWVVVKLGPDMSYLGLLNKVAVLSASLQYSHSVNEGAE